MSQSNKYDDLDEMLVPQDNSVEEEDIHVGGPAKAPNPPKKAENKTPHQLAKEAKKRRETMHTVTVVALVFAIVLTLLIMVGVAMSKRAGTDKPNRPTQQVVKADPDPDKTAFVNSSNIPELSVEGVKGMLKEAYYTKNGDLAVTLNLSNGTASEHQLVRVNARIFNAAGETVAQETVDKFEPECFVPAGGYGEVYFVIKRENVVLRNDPLSELGTTLEIGSQPTDGSGKTKPTSDGKGPKDIAAGRTYYENTGNIPELSADGIKGSIIRARYTNDGSLAVTLSLSNGMDEDHAVTKVDLMLENGEGGLIVNHSFDEFEERTVVKSKSYNEIDLIVDTSYVNIHDDPLSKLACTVSIGSGPA